MRAGSAAVCRRVPAQHSAGCRPCRCQPTSCVPAAAARLTVSRNSTRAAAACPLPALASCASHDSWLLTHSSTDVTQSRALAHRQREQQTQTQHQLMRLDSAVQHRTNAAHHAASPAHLVPSCVSARACLLAFHSVMSAGGARSAAGSPARCAPTAAASAGHSSGVRSARRRTSRTSRHSLAGQQAAAAAWCERRVLRRGAPAAHARVQRCCCNARAPPHLLKYSRTAQGALLRLPAPASSRQP